MQIRDTMERNKEIYSPCPVHTNGKFHLVKYKDSHGVRIAYSMDVQNIIIKTVGDSKIARKVRATCTVFLSTIGCIQENCVFSGKS